MRGDVVDPHGFGVADQVSEHAQTARKPHLDQSRAFLLGQSGSHELRQILAGLVKNSQRPVAGADQVHGGGHNALQHRGQLHLPGDGHHRVQQTLNPFLGGGQSAQLLIDPAQLGIQTLKPVRARRPLRSVLLLAIRHHDRLAERCSFSVAFSR